MNFKISSDGTTAVSTQEPWLPMDTVPKNVRCQVLTKHGKATNAIIKAEVDKLMYVAWAPFPYTPDWLKQTKA